MKRIDTLINYLSLDNESILIKNEKNIFYFTGFMCDCASLFITKKQIYFLTDSRYFESAKNTLDRSIEIIMTSYHTDMIAKLCDELSIETVFIEENEITLSMYAAMCKKIKADISSDFMLSSKILMQRMIKSDEEIKCMQKAQRISERALENALDILKPGMKERDIAARIEYDMKLLGAQDTSFDLITITGKNTSLPHGVPGDTTVQNGDFFIFDIGCIYKGYCSDMTRTVAVGDVTDEMKKVYDIVLEAHNRAAKTIRPGNNVKDVDLAARTYIEQTGYGDFFGHSTGHGVGLDIHEMPAVFKTRSVLIKKGMVFTDEPGIYLEGRFGVRIEDMYLVTENGAESFANIDKKLIVL